MAQMEENKLVLLCGVEMLDRGIARDLCWPLLKKLHGFVKFFL